MGHVQTDVLIVGAGPVGLFSALRLCQAGLSPRIIDQEARTARHSFALCLHPQTLEHMAEAKLAEAIVGLGTPLSRVAFFGDGRRLGELHYDRLSTRFPFLLVLPQSTLEDELLGQLEQLGVGVQWNTRLGGLSWAREGEPVLATLEELEPASSRAAVAGAGERVVKGKSSLAAACVLGADGHRSRVRRALDAAFVSFGPARLFSVFEFTAASAQVDEVRVTLDENVGVLWPLGRDRYRFSFEVDPTDAIPTERDKRHLVDLARYQGVELIAAERLSKFIAESAPWFSGRIQEVTWSVAVQFEQRLSTVLGRGGVWLAGDALHLAPPVGVQSMNFGLDESYELTSAMAKLIRTRASAENVLSEYSRRWGSFLHTWLAAPHPVHALASAPAWARMRQVQIAQVIPASGPHLPALLGQLGLALGPGDLV